MYILILSSVAIHLSSYYRSYSNDPGFFITKISNFSGEEKCSILMKISTNNKIGDKDEVLVAEQSSQDSTF